MLLDVYLPVFDVRERHGIVVDAPVERAWEAARHVDLARSPLIRTLMTARSAPLIRGGRRVGVRSLRLDDLLRHGFVVLAEDPPEEIVLGAAGTFWRPRNVIHPVTAAGFADLDDPGVAKAAMNFAVRPVDDGRCAVLTETRIRCTDEASRRKFVLYWAAVGPFSALIRTRALKLIKHDAERSGGAGPGTMEGGRRSRG